ncbi:Origin recognition complex subunit 4, C-terminal, partial [Dillenia turbinata]
MGPEEALILLRTRLCDPHFLFSFSFNSSDSNYSKLKFIISSSVTEACNNSVLLLGLRGCGKIAVLELVLRDLLVDYPDLISVIRLNGLLHSDENGALKEIVRQLCLEHELVLSKVCGLVHKTVIFVPDEFDLFAQGKQRLLYSLLDAMQTVTSQAVIVGDADQLLEKRVRSRFSHRKLLFLPPSNEELYKTVEHVLILPTDSSLPHDYAHEFNRKLHKSFTFNQTVNTLLKFVAVSHRDLNFGFLTLDNFKTALSSFQRQPKLECVQDCFVLELYILVCIQRLEIKEQNSYNFNSIMKEYKSIHSSFQTSDHYAQTVCLRLCTRLLAFEHLQERELICFTDNRSYNQSAEFRPTKILISYHELSQ